MVNVEKSFGALFIGCLASMALSAIAAAQVWLYFQRFPSDPRVLKTLVSVLSFLDIFHIIIVSSSVWRYLVAGWGDESVIGHLTWTIAFSVVLTAFITCLVQCFFAHRLWRLSSKHWYISVIIVVLVFLRVASGIANAVYMWRLQSFPEYIQQFRWLYTLSLALSTVGDLIITSAMCYLLQSSRTGYAKMDSIITGIILYTLNNGILTCAGSIASLICAVAMPTNLIFMSLHFTIAKLHTNSLLSSLNSRNSLRNRLDDEAVHRMPSHFSKSSRSGKFDIPIQPMPNRLDKRSSSGYAASLNSSDAGAEARSPKKLQVQVDIEQTIERDNAKYIISATPDWKENSMLSGLRH